MAFNHRVVMITGATGGLGQVAARAFANQGAKLALVSSNLDKLNTLLSSLALPDGQAQAFAADLSRTAEAKSAVEQAAQTFGRLDVLVHLVGGWDGGQPVTAVSPERVDAMLQQHLWTTFHLAQACIPVMAANRWGRILAISSPTAQRPTANSAPYAIAKAAQEALMLTLSQEVKDSGITANLLLVRTIDVKHERQNSPSPKNAAWTTPEEITATLLHLCTQEAGTINGARIPVYGGY